MNAKKFVALLLSLVMVLSLAACGNQSAATAEVAESASEGTETAEVTEAAEQTEEVEEVEEADGLVGVRANEDYDEVSAELYEGALGEFYEYYSAAAAMTDTNERYAAMAIAEAKLLESGVMLPTTSPGGTYVRGRFAPNTCPSVKWGGDMNRYEQMLITEEPVTAEDWTAMRALFAEKQGTGTYHEAAEAYLTENGYTLKDEYNFIYTADPESWDVFSEWNSTLYEPLCLTFDNLMQYDCENTLQPALAESYEMTENADGTVTYTFKIREGVMWVDSQGREVAEVCADDFVAGAQHLFDTGSGIEDLLTVDGAYVVGATDLYYGESSD